MTAPARWLRRLGMAGTALLALAAALVALLQLPPVATAVVRRLLPLAPLNPGNRLAVGRVSGNPFGGLTLEDVRLRQSGRELGHIQRLRLEYRVPELLGTVRRLDAVALDGAVLTARRGAGGWDLLHVVRASADTTGGGGLAVGRLRVRNAALAAVLSPDSVAHVRVLDLAAHDLVLGDTARVAIDSLGLAVQPPATGRWFAVRTRGAVTADEIRLDPFRVQTELSRLTGRLVLPRRFDDERRLDHLDVRLAARPLDLGDLAAVVPAVPPEGKLELEAAAGAERGLVTAHLAASLDRARLTLRGATRLRAGKLESYRVDAAMRRLDLSRLVASAPAGELNGRLDADLEGAPARGGGRVRLELERSRLGPAVLRRLRLDARLAGGAADLALRAALDTGLVRATGRIRPFDSIPSYRLDVRALALPGTGAMARALDGREGDPELALDLRLAGTGSAPTSARARGLLRLAAERRGERTSLGAVPFRLAAGRLHLSPQLRAVGGTITGEARVQLGDTVRYDLRDGRIRALDLGRLTGDTLAGPLSGSFSLAGSGLPVRSARMRARLQLRELRYGGRRMERLDAVAQLEGGRIRLEAGGPLEGGRAALVAAGRPFDSTATWELRRAALERVDVGALLDRPGLAGPVTLQMTGTAELRAARRSARARLDLAPSRMGRVELGGGTARVRLTGGRLAFDADIRSSAGDLTLAGNGATGGEPAYRIGAGRITSADLGALLGRPGLHTDVNLTFTAEVTGRTPDRSAVLAAALLPSRVNQAELTDGSLEARLTGRRWSGKLRVSGPGAVLEAAANVEPDSAGTTTTASGTARVEGLARWTGRRDADGRLESRFALEARSDSAGLRSLGGTVDALGGVGAVRVPALHVALTPADGELRVDTLSLRSNVAVLDGGGRLALRPGVEPGTLAVAGTLGDLAPAAELAGADTVAFDSARVRLAVTGPAWRWKLDGGADAYGVTFGGNLAGRIRVQGAASFDSTHVGGASGRLDIRDAAYGRLTVPELTAAGAYDSTLALDLDVNVADSVRVASSIRGAISQARDTVTAEIQRLTLNEGGRAWALARPAAFTLGPRVEVHGLALRAGPRSIALDGVLDRRGTSDVTLSVAGLDLETLRAAGLVPVGGRLDGSLRLTGPADAPRLRGKMELAIMSKRQRLGTVGGNLDWTARGLRIAAAATPLRGGALTVTGSLPYRLTLAPRDSAARAAAEPTPVDTVALAVRADSFDLALFEPLLPPDAARGLHGRLAADARIGGTVHAPDATGRVSLTRGALEIPALNVGYEHVELSGRLEADSLLVERLGLRTGKHETLAATGRIRLRPLSEPGLDLSGTLEHFRISDSKQLQTAASGRIRLRGTLLQPAVSGTLRLDRTNFFVGAGAAQARVEQVELTPAQRRQLARDFGPSVLRHGRESPGLLERTRLDLAIRMPGQVWIRRTSSPEMDIELTGDVRLTQAPGGEMRFFGHVEPVPERGTIGLSGRQFRLTGGDINLAGPVDSTKLDVNANYQVPTQGGGNDEGVLIGVNAKGRLDSLGLTFTSDPAMSQDDIFSYIVTGRPASDNPLFEGEGGGATGEQVAMSTLTGAISNAAGQSLGLDVFQIRQEPARGLTLTAGRYLSSRLFLDLQLPLQLGAQSQQSGSSSLGPGFEVEYTLRRWLRANLQGGSLSPGFLLRGRRAY